MIKKNECHSMNIIYHFMSVTSLTETELDIQVIKHHKNNDFSPNNFSFIYCNSKSIDLRSSNILLSLKI